MRNLKIKRKRLLKLTRNAGRVLGEFFDALRNLLQGVENLITRSCHLPHIILDFMLIFRSRIGTGHNASEASFKRLRIFAAGINLARALFAVKNQAVRCALNLIDNVLDFLDAVNDCVRQTADFSGNNVKILASLAGT